MSHNASTTVVGRLAPSPTGGLHLGHARTFLIAWMNARLAGGRVVLRIDDLDPRRTRPDMATQAIDDLRWLGLDWDEGPDVGGPNGPYMQSLRSAHYESALRRLIEAELVYPCTCTRAEISRIQTAPHAGEEGPLYSGTCAGRSTADALALYASGRPFAWRFRAARATVFAWTDLAQGPLSLPVGGDFVVGRSTGETAYQLAVVVDDDAMAITHVVRGDDLIPSTPRQLALYAVLGLTPPTYAHVALVLDAEGDRLAKRDQSLKLATLRERGADPRQLIGRLAHSCGWTDAAVPTSPIALLANRSEPIRLPTTPLRIDDRFGENLNPEF